MKLILFLVILLCIGCKDGEGVSRINADKTSQNDNLIPDQNENIISDPNEDIISDQNEDLFIEGASDMNDSNVVDGLEYLSSREYIERTYPSPKGGHFVYERVPGVRGNVHEYFKYFYLGSSRDELFILYAPSIRSPFSGDSVVWLDESTFIFDGRYIYDVEAKEKIKSLLEETLKNNYLMNWSMNHDKSKIAYCIINSSNYRVEIYEYTLETHEVKKIYDFEALITSISTVLNITWDLHNNIYFDTSYRGEEYQVYMYECGENQVSLYYEDVVLGPTSQDKRFISILDYKKRTTILIDTLEDERYDLDYTYNFLFLDGSMLVHIPLGNSDELRMTRLEGGIKTEVKVISLRDIKIEECYVENLQLVDGQLTLDLVKYKDHRFKSIVLEAKRYRVKLEEVEGIE